VSKTILIIDDESSLRLLMKRFLDIAGYNVLEAKDGKEGLALAKTKHPDLILLDIQMPNMNGYQVDQELAADPRLKDIPTVLVTGTSQCVGDGIKLEINAKYKLSKPFGKDDLINIVEKALSSVKIS